MDSSVWISFWVFNVQGSVGYEINFTRILFPAEYHNDPAMKKTWLFFCSLLMNAESGWSASNDNFKCQMPFSFMLNVTWFFFFFIPPAFELIRWEFFRCRPNLNKKSNLVLVQWDFINHMARFKKTTTTLHYNFAAMW